MAILLLLGIDGFVENDVLDFMIVCVNDFWGYIFYGEGVWSLSDGYCGAFSSILVIISLSRDDVFSHRV